VTADGLGGGEDCGDRRQDARYDRKTYRRDLLYEKCTGGSISRACVDVCRTRLSVWVGLSAPGRRVDILRSGVARRNHSRCPALDADVRHEHRIQTTASSRSRQPLQRGLYRSESRVQGAA